MVLGSLPVAPGTHTHSSVLLILCILLQSFHGGFQSKSLMLWPDGRTSKRQDGLAYLQDCGLPGRLSGKDQSVYFLILLCPYTTR